MAVEVGSIRLEWEEAYRAFSEATRDPSHGHSLAAQVDVVLDELRRRLGGVFTLGELAEEYGRADVWAHAALAERGAPGWPRTLTVAEGAAFHVYSRGAVDYAP